MSGTADLPDLNVWLALIWPDHSHHHQAIHDWEQQATDQVLFSTLTALGLVRLVCQPEADGHGGQKRPRSLRPAPGPVPTTGCAAGRAGPQRLGGVSPPAAWR